MIHTLMERTIRRDNDKSFWLLIALVLLNLIVGAAIGFAPINPMMLWGGFLVLCITAALLLPLLYVWQRDGTLLQPITTFVVTAFGYVLGSIFLLFGGQSNSLDYALNDTNLSSFVAALGVVLLGILSFMFAYLLFSRGRYPDEVSTDGEHKVIVEESKPPVGLLLAILVLCGLGLIGYYLFVSSSGGLSFLLNNIYGRTLFRGSEYYRVLFRYLQVATWVWFAYDRDCLKKPFFWALVILNVIMLISLGTRAPIIIYVFWFIVLHVLRSGKMKVSITPGRFMRYIFGGTLFAVFAASIMFGLLAWRSASVTARQERRALTGDLIATQLVSYSERDLFLSTTLGQANLASIESVATVVEAVPDRIPLLYGKTIYWIFLLPIPRAIWPEKPVVTTGVYIERALYDSNAAAGGVPPSWIGELFLNWHIGGVIVGCFLFGLGSAYVYRWYNRQRYHTPLVQLSYTLYMIYFMFTLTKTEFKTAVNSTIMILIPIVMAYVIMQLIKPTVESAH